MACRRGYRVRMDGSLKPREMTDSEIRIELTYLPETAPRHAMLQAELEERTLARRAEPRPPGWHAATDLCEGT
jgi:hypothetical protein